MRAHNVFVRVLPGCVTFVALTVVATDTRAQCGHEICPPEPAPPPPCQAVNQSFDDSGCPADFDTNDMDFCFADRVPDGSGFPSNDTNDAQIYVVGNNANRSKDCGIIRVKETGYYAIFDSELSESCADQQDETGYLTIQNSCNGDGWATTRNVENRYLVRDQDNTGAGCMSDGECGTDQVCREGNNHGNCCVPADPVYMGTFLLVAGEENVICINHWCPEWKDLASQDPTTFEDLFVHDTDNASNNCTSADSIHFKIAATANACIQRGILQACQGGCADGVCLGHPCEDASCPDYCVQAGDGSAACVPNNPCAGVQCAHGCVYGLCLQGPDAVGNDGDGDGFVDVSDCDDDDANVFPGANEDCGNGKDDDCDGSIDNCGQGGSSGFLDGGLNAGGSGAVSNAGTAGTNATTSSGDSGDSGGCGCRTEAGSKGRGLTLLSLLGLGLLLRRRRDGAAS